VNDHAGIPKKLNDTEKTRSKFLHLYPTRLPGCHFLYSIPHLMSPTKICKQKIFSVSFAFSVNLCLAASICLISRVSNDPTAFYLLSISLCAFCFWPILRNQLNKICNFLPLLLLVLLGPASIYALQVISFHLVIFHALIHLFIVVICPILLIRMQPYKK
jgi:hypothetical protein